MIVFVKIYNEEGDVDVVDIEDIEEDVVDNVHAKFQTCCKCSKRCMVKFMEMSSLSPREFIAQW